MLEFPILRQQGAEPVERAPRQSRAACGQVPGAAEPTPVCCASARGMPRWHRDAAPRLPGSAA